MYHPVAESRRHGDSVAEWETLLAEKSFYFHLGENVHSWEGEKIH